MRISRKIRTFGHHYCLVFAFRVALTGGERMDVVIAGPTNLSGCCFPPLLRTASTYIPGVEPLHATYSYSPILQRVLEECEVKKATLAQTERREPPQVILL